MLERRAWLEHLCIGNEVTALGSERPRRRSVRPRCLVLGADCQPKTLAVSKISGLFALARGRQASQAVCLLEIHCAALPS
jgi:hypothetical protein